MDASKARAVVTHEIKDIIIVSTFVIAFFLSFTTYRMYLAGHFENAMFNYASALISALVLAKVILIGEAFRLGRLFENKPLIVPTIHKAAMFTLFCLVFHAIEECVRGLIKGEHLRTAVHSVATAKTAEETVFRALVFFFAFIPFFALRETMRVMNIDDFRLFFRRRQSPPTDAALKPLQA
jgi:hypothetical protein